MFENEAAGTQEALEAPGTEVGTGLFPSTPAPAKPVPQPQAHRGRITGVAAVTFDSGARAIQVTWKSIEDAREDNFTIFPPQAYIDNILIDPETLNKVGPTVQNDDGTTYTADSDFVKYAKNVRNSKGDGKIEFIAALALEQGHTPTMSHTPLNFNQLGEYLNGLCTGTDVIALLRAQGGDGDFSDRLRTTRFASPEHQDNPKFFKNYRKLWAE